MNPIGDQLSVNSVVTQSRAQRARPAVVEAGHRIVRMRGLRDACVNGRGSLLECSCRVPQYNAHTGLKRPPDQGIRSRRLRSQRNHSDRASGQKFFKLFEGCGPYESRVLRAGKLRAEKRPLQVNAKQACAGGPVLTVSRP